MIKRYPHTFIYQPSSGGMSGGEYLPGTKPDTVNFEGRFTAKPKLIKNADGSMSQVSAKINCPVLTLDLKKGEALEYENRSYVIYQVGKNQKAWVIWVE